jgi:hypothetical protein
MRHTRLSRTEGLLLNFSEMLHWQTERECRKSSKTTEHMAGDYKALATMPLEEYFPTTDSHGLLRSLPQLDKQED